MNKGKLSNVLFKDAQASKPDVKGVWGGHLDGSLTGGRGATADELKGHDCASIEGAPGAGKFGATKFKGS